jgi:small subunit ribosomal protein S1
MEENPWDVFEKHSSMSTASQGTIIDVMDKGAVVSLPLRGKVLPRQTLLRKMAPPHKYEKIAFK